MPALKYWDGSAWQYVASGAAPANTTGQMVDARWLPASANLGAGAQFIPGFYVVLPAARTYLVHLWLTIGAPGPGDSGIDVSVQMAGAAGQEYPTAAFIIDAGKYVTITAQWHLRPAAAGLVVPNQVNGWINCNPVTIYRGTMHAVDAGTG